MKDFGGNVESRNNIANLQRELQLFIMNGNDYMAEKIQSLIDQELQKKQIIKNEEGEEIFAINGATQENFKLG